MHVACFVKALIIILSKMHVACFVKTFIVILFKEIEEQISCCLYLLKLRCMLYILLKH